MVIGALIFREGDTEGASLAPLQRFARNYNMLTGDCHTGRTQCFVGENALLAMTTC
jgi:hypothetical protein